MLTTTSRIELKQAPEKPPIQRFSTRKLIEIVLALVLLVAIPECVFSLAGIGEQEFLEPDAHLGFAPMANKAITWRQEGFSRSSENSHGMPDLERTLAKPPGVFRIAVVGDSLTQAFEVDRNENYCQLVEKQLNEMSPGKKFEFLNFSISACNMGQMYLNLKHRVWPFQPDLVILPVRVDGVMLLAPNPGGGFLYARPSFFVGEGGKLIQDDTVLKLFNKSPEAKRLRDTAWLRQHSRIWGVVSTCMGNYMRWQTKMLYGLKNFRLARKGTVSVKAPAAAPAPAATAAAAPAVADNGEKVFYAEDPGTTKFLWPIADALIGAIKDECGQHRVPLLVVRMPGATRRHNDVETALLQRSVEKWQLPLLDLTPRFDAVEPTKTWYIFHLTPLGHKMVADNLIKFMQENQFLPL